MGAPTYTADDYLAALQSILPRGKLWPTDPDAILTNFLSGLTPTFARVTSAAAALLVDAFPATAVNFLPEWEETLGLPDPCAGAAPTTAARQAQCTARFAGVGGSSIAYLIGYAAQLGYTITITEYRPKRVNDPVNMPMYGLSWAHAIQINAPVGDNLVLECEIKAIRPAHVAVHFNYT
jgi:uncharacterized protein YmfQ (DUF2313 family)